MKRSCTLYTRDVISDATHSPASTRFAHLFGDGHGIFASEESAGPLTKEQFQQLFEQQDRSASSTLVEKHSAVLTGKAVPRTVLMRHALLQIVSKNGRSSLSADEISGIRDLNLPSALSTPRADATLDQACDLLERAGGGVDDAHQVAILLMQADVEAEDELSQTYQRAVERLSPQGRAAFAGAMKRSEDSVHFKRIDLVALSAEMPEILLQQWREGCDRRSTMRETGLPPSVIRTVPLQESVR